MTPTGREGLRTPVCWHARTHAPMSVAAVTFTDSDSSSRPPTCRHPPTSRRRAGPRPSGLAGRPAGLLAIVCHVKTVAVCPACPCVRHLHLSTRSAARWQQQQQQLDSLAWPGVASVSDASRSSRCRHDQTFAPPLPHRNRHRGHAAWLTSIHTTRSSASGRSHTRVLSPGTLCPTTSAPWLILSRSENCSNHTISVKLLILLDFFVFFVF